MRMNAESQTPTAPETWDFWDDGVRAPAMNMAVDEALLLQAAARGRPLLRFYAWDRPAVTIGYVQAFAAAPAEGYTVIRRTTGGGVVFHDHDLTHSVVIPAGHWLTSVPPLQSYAFVNDAVRQGLAGCQVAAELAQQEIPKTVDRLRMVCFTTPTRYDVMLGNRKIAGAAQRRTREGILHQGSIHFGEKLPLPRAELIRRIREAFRERDGITFAEFAPSPELLALADELAKTRYGTDEWNRLR
jgi:lipoate-protein ligase A